MMPGDGGHCQRLPVIESAKFRARNKNNEVSQGRFPLNDFITFVTRS
jgi:hypothetical protein